MPNPRSVVRRAETGFNQRNKMRKARSEGKVAGGPGFLKGQGLSVFEAGLDRVSAMSVSEVSGEEDS